VSSLSNQATKLCGQTKPTASIAAPSTWKPFLRVVDEPQLT